MPKNRMQFRISHLLWCMLVVAAFFSGRHWSARPAEPTSTQSTPIAIDFAFPTKSASESAAPEQTFSFYIGIAR